MFIFYNFSNSQFSKAFGLNCCDVVFVEIILSLMGLFSKMICYLFDLSFLRPIDREYCSATASCFSTHEAF